MSRILTVIEAGPQMSIQDLGRPGFLSVGLSRGGGADRLALAEGAVLLGQKVSCAALEMAGTGGVFEASQPVRIALTGAPMRARIGGRDLVWNASHILQPGERLSIGPALKGSYGYLSVAGGFETPVIMGSRAAHLMARIGSRIGPGETLPIGRDADPSRSANILDVEDRFEGGTVRVVPGGQTELFSANDRTRLEETEFVRSTRGNRQGVRFDFEGAPFGAEGLRTVLSEMIVPGDIQMTGDGTPFVLLPECQTTGGYPRIGSILPQDLPIVAQAAPGARLRFHFLTLDAARAAYEDEAASFRALAKKVRPLVRDPHDMADLLSYQLISGATSGQFTHEEGEL